MSGMSSYAFSALLEKMTNADTDYRYMALNDLTADLSKDNVKLDDRLSDVLVNAVLKLVNDKNAEVQNMAVKTLGPLIKRISESKIDGVIDKLCAMASQTQEDSLRDLATMGLKTVFSELPTANETELVVAVNVCKRITPQLIDILQNPKASYETQLEILDLLSDILFRFGSSMKADGLVPIQKALIPLLTHPRPAVRKRAVVAIGNLAAQTPEELFEKMISQLLNDVKTTKSQDQLKTLVQCLGNLSRNSAQRIGKHISEFVPQLLQYTKKTDDDELRDNCLQSLELLVLRCPTEITPYIDETIQHALTYLRYDPNYAADDEGEEEEAEQDDAMDADEDDDDDLEDEEEDIDYSDDDDISWKVRRSSSKLLAAVIATRIESLPMLYNTVAPVLISRFNEREESVRLDVLQTFIGLLRQTYIASSGSRALAIADADDVTFGDEDRIKRIKGDGHSVVPMETEERELVNVLQGGLENQISLLRRPIQAPLAASTGDHHHSTTTSNLKIEVLAFLRQLFRTHAPRTLQPCVGVLALVVIQCAAEKFHKIAAEAFLVCIELLKVLRPINYDVNTNTYTAHQVDASVAPLIHSVYDTSVSRLSVADVDQEVRERAIVCLGTVLSQSADILAEKQVDAMKLLLERLENEITRLPSIKTLSMVVRSPVCDNNVIRDQLLSSFDLIVSLLRKSNRHLRIATLSCVDEIVKKFGKSLSMGQNSQLLKELRPLVTDNDLHLLPLTLRVIVSMLHGNPSSADLIKTEIMPSVLVLVRSPLIQGAALDALLSLFQAFVRSSPADFHGLLAGLLQPTEQPSFAVNQGGHQFNRQSASTIAQCVATLCLNSQNEAGSTINGLADKLKDQNAPTGEKYVALLALGETGRTMDLSHIPDLPTAILGLFDSPSEEVKSAAAFALGNISVGSGEVYLPIIIDGIQTDKKKRYLLLHALKEVIARYSKGKEGAVLEEQADKIWTLLFETCDTDDEGTSNVVAECIGKLTLTNPYKYLPELQKRLHSSSPQTRGMVISALKFTFTDQGQSYDELLKPLIVEFLSLMQDSDLNVRRLSLATLNSAVHNKPYLIREVLNQLLPLLYQETIVRPELVHEVQMGPFKHKVDDGLEIRKAAFECMYSLLGNCLEKIDVFAFLDRVLLGLSDEHDVKILCYLMLNRLEVVASTAVTQRLDAAAEPLKKTLDHKPKGNAVKQEVEKNQELVRSALRCIASLARLSDPLTTPKFDHILKDIKKGPWANIYAEAERDRDDREFLD
ncbi:hypothetical protein BZG36_01399 [Bifiguratus adelaidae]|uniref:TOG domain-containing protein n=1 Tax=Bifiguratus adelaidae TaxID=1938954 RepID=A0A261Y3F1_9FUNG|nr:hypothetical protein BZG36_01399 [Bifiguratus adelaidae]